MGGDFHANLRLRLSPGRVVSAGLLLAYGEPEISSIIYAHTLALPDRMALNKDSERPYPEELDPRGGPMTAERGPKVT